MFYYSFSCFRQSFSQSTGWPWTHYPPTSAYWLPGPEGYTTVFSEKWFYLSRFKGYKFEENPLGSWEMATKVDLLWPVHAHTRVHTCTYTHTHTHSQGRTVLPHPLSTPLLSSFYSPGRKCWLTITSYNAPSLNSYLKLWLSKQSNTNQSHLRMK